MTTENEKQSEQYTAEDEFNDLPPVADESEAEATPEVKDALEVETALDEEGAPALEDALETLEEAVADTELADGEEPSEELAAAEDEAAATAQDAAAARPKSNTILWAVIAAVALIAGLFIGATFLGSGGGSLGKATVTENELDSVLASYTYAGGKGEITVRDAITQSSSLASAKDGEGNYAVPAVDIVLSLARNNILAEEAAKEGIEVTDEEVATYAENSLGSSDYATIAQQYGMDETLLKEMLANTCKLDKLQKQVITESAGEEPTAPAEPKNSKNKDKAAKKYADYIIALVGDEWDAEKGTWASETGMYAQILKDYKVTAEGATYEAANTAYETAAQVYSSNASTAWSNYLKELFSKASIQISSLMS